MEEMNIQELTNLLLNSGVTIVVIGYFIWRDFKFLDTLKTTLLSLTNTIDSLKECVNEMKTALVKK